MLSKLTEYYIICTNRLDYGFRNIGNFSRFLQMGATAALVLKVFGVTTNKSIIIPLVAMLIIVTISWMLGKTKLQAKQLKYDSERNRAWVELVEQVKRLENKIDELRK